MCGIAGFLCLSKQISEEEGTKRVVQMSDQLSHRGPDASGAWCDASQGIFLGHRRLSILDLSNAGAQPMISHCERYVMSYNGEIYNTKDLLLDLKRKLPTIRFRGHSDTEILLESFAHLGIEKTLHIAKGMFAIALWDRQDQVLFLMRDHLGKKPLYVGLLEDKLVFASELKALRVLSAASLPLDREAFQSYRYFGFIPAPQSVYKNIFKLRPAHVVSLRRADLICEDASVITEKMEPYWRLQKNKELLSQEESRELLKKTLSSAVARRMVSDVPLGAFLSGGIDSSLIAAMMQEQSDRPIKTYTIAFDDERYDESRHAQRISKRLGTDHTVYTVAAEDTKSIITDLPTIYDEPFADYSQIPTVLLCRQARKDTVVALSGDGGDEVFCGYKRYFMLKRLLSVSGNVPFSVRKVIAMLLLSGPQNILNRLHLNGKRLHSIAGFLQERDFQSAVLRTLSIQPNLPCPPGLHLGDYEGLDELEQMMMIDTHLYLPDDILVKVDRASMSSSLEVRSPLLDKDVLELAWRMPIEDKVFPCMSRGKKPLYDLLCDYVPRELIDRPKQGFTPPVAQWLRGDLKEWANDLLQTETPVFERRDKQALWDDFISGRKDNHSALWGVLMAQSWYLSQKR